MQSKTPEEVESERILEALGLVEQELLRAMQLHDSMTSAHHGYAVILEELDELWDEVKKRSSIRDLDHMWREAIQVAAMGLRFAIDVCMRGRGTHGS